ncbi:MAG: hypothetical protein ACPG5U_01945 [Planktomarina sp.]
MVVVWHKPILHDADYPVFEAVADRRGYGPRHYYFDPTPWRANELARDPMQFRSQAGHRGCRSDPVVVGRIRFGFIIALPSALGSRHWINPLDPWGPAEWALVGSSMIHALVYSGYVMVVGRFGSVFSVQVRYLVTLSSIGWAMLMLGESHTGPIWLSLGLMLTVMYLVAPKPQSS